MFTLIAWGTLIVLVIGLVAKFFLDKTESELRITKGEFAIAAPVMLLIVIPLTAYVGVQAAIQNQLTFSENLCGFEVEAEWIKTPCVRDGGMRWSYKGDPYIYTWYETVYETHSDGKGGTYTTSHQEMHSETRYHDIPYCSEEWTFVVHTTLGNYTIADRNLPTRPNDYRFRSYVSVPEDLPHGIPQFWQNAKDRLDRNDAGPVVKRHDYTNYILASQSSILRRFNDAIADYKKQGLMPKLNGSIHDFYYSDRVYFVGVQPTVSEWEWQRACDRFDAALGTNLQGDMHVVIVDAAKISNPDNYAGAVIANWQSPEEYGADAFSKNGILLVLGTDGKTVKWSRAYTGMPMGNEALMLDLRQKLVGCKLDPESLFGHPTAFAPAGSKDINHTKGAIENIVWGTNAFKRVHMGEGGEGGGFTYLLSELNPTTGQIIGILVIMTLFTGFAWGACIAYGPPVMRSRSNLMRGNISVGEVLRRNRRNFD